MLDRVMDGPTPYKYRHLPALLIQHAVWFYVRFALSLRDVEDFPTIAESMSRCETVRRRRHALTRSSDRLAAAIPGWGPGDLGRGLAGHVPPIDEYQRVSTAPGLLGAPTGATPTEWTGRSGSIG
jgi:hypothetical protein